MPRIAYERVFNPTPVPAIVNVFGKELVFDPYKITPVHVSDELKLQDFALQKITTVAGANGCSILDPDELAGGKDADQKTEEERRSYASDYIDKLVDVGNNKCIDMLRREFVDHHEADDRRLMGAGKKVMHISRQRKLKLALLDEMEQQASRMDRLTSEEEINAVRRQVRTVDRRLLKDLKWPELRKHARGLGYDVPNKMTREELMGMMFRSKPQMKPESADEMVVNADLEPEMAAQE